MNQLKMNNLVLKSKNNQKKLIINKIPILNKKRILN